MEVHVRAHSGILETRVIGRFDAHTVEAFTQKVVEGVGPATPTVALDLGAVEFMDSSALAALVTTLKRSMQHGGEVLIVALSDTARIILELTRLDEVFPRVDSFATARLRSAAPRAS